jgi:hypothetical protein
MYLVPRTHGLFITETHSFISCIHTIIMIYIRRLTMLSYGAIPCYSPCWFPFANSPCQFLPFLESLLLTWNSSFCVVRFRPPWSQVARKLTSPSPFPPHSKFLSPQGFPSLIVRPTKTTSWSRLRIVRINTNEEKYFFALSWHKYCFRIFREYVEWAAKFAHLGQKNLGYKIRQPSRFFWWKNPEAKNLVQVYL